VYQQNAPRPSLIVKLKMASVRRNAACKACQLLKSRCEWDDQALSTSCKRCAWKKIDCVMPIPSPKRRKLSHSADPTNSSRQSSKQPVQSPKSQNGPSLGNQPVLNSDARENAQHKRLQDDGSQLSSPAASTEQPQAKTSEHQVQASPQDTSTPSTNPKSTPHSSNDPPPSMMLFPITQIRQVLDIYDRRKQRIQYLEAQVDDLQQNLNYPTKIADQDGSKLPNNNAALDQQRSLIAALGGALVQQAKIEDLNALYNLLDDLGVDQGHYWALYDNEEFRKSFPVSCDDKRSKSVQVEKTGDESALQQALEAINHTPSYSTSAKSLRTQIAHSTPTGPKMPSDNHLRSSPSSKDGARHFGDRTRNAEVEKSGGEFALQQALGHMPSSSTNTTNPPQNQPTESPPAWSQSPSDKHLQALASRASADPAVKELMRAVASSNASVEQVKQFKSQMEEISRSVGSDNEKRLS
jgi:hypothetical protein